MYYEKKTIKVEASFCDLCGKKSQGDTCINCGIDICWACRGNLKQYPTSVWGSSSLCVCGKCSNGIIKEDVAHLINLSNRLAALHKRAEDERIRLRYDMDKDEEEMESALKFYKLGRYAK